MAANVKSFIPKNQHCEQCKGTCYDKDQFKRQENARAKFGVIPNLCVDSTIGGCKCPYQP